MTDENIGVPRLNNPKPQESAGRRYLNWQNWCTRNRKKDPEKTHDWFDWIAYKEDHADDDEEVQVVKEAVVEEPQRTTVSDAAAGARASFIADLTPEEYVAVVSFIRQRRMS